MHVLPIVVRGKVCPRCGSRTERIPTPLLLRPFRWVFPASVRRRCYTRCGWAGFALPAAEAQSVRGVDTDSDPLLHG